MRRQRPYAKSVPGFTPLFAACASMAVVGCSSSSDSPTPDTTAPAASSFVQDRDGDPTGQTVAVTFSEAVTATTAEVAASYTFNGGLITQSATLRGDGRTVDIVLNGLALPGTNTISIAEGIEDAAGNASEGVTAEALTSSDTTAPAAAMIIGTTIEGPENDTISVTFSDDMIESEVETLANWTIEAPMGTAFDVTGATVDYVAATRTATITLGAASADKNLQTFDDIHATFTTMRDLGGNVVTTTNIGTTAVTATIGGDATPPTLLSAGASGGVIAFLTFSEDVAGAETLDLMSGLNPTGTELTLTDLSDPGTAAAGSIELTDVVSDTDSVTISDGTTVVEFEFDYGAVGSVTLDNLPADTDSVTIGDGNATETFEFESGGGAIATEVTIGVSTAETAGNLIAAINLSATIDVTASPGVTADSVALRNDNTGALGNVLISAVDFSGVAISFTGMAGGGISGDVTVPVDIASPGNTALSLQDAINGNGFSVTAAPGGSSTEITVTNNAAGLAGNTTISETDATGVITVANMTGGTDPSTRTYEPSVSSSSGDPLQVSLTFAVAPAAFDTLRVYGITDLAGNQMPPSIDFAFAVEDTNPPNLDNGNSTVTAKSGEENDEIVIVFDGDVHPAGVTEIANYSLDNGASVDLAGAIVEQTETDEVTITLGPDSTTNIQSDDTFSLSVNNIRNLFGAQRTIADVDGGINPAGDTAAPTVAVGDAKLDAADATAVFVEFDEALDATTASDIANYAITGNTTSAAVLVNPRVVRLSFTSPPGVADSISITGGGQTDRAGNDAGSSASVAITAADVTAPTVTSVSGVADSDRHTITVTFEEPWRPASAETSGNYSARIIGGDPISLTGATFTGISTSNEVIITLAEGVYLTTGEDIGVTVVNVTDVAGNAIVAAETTATITGDGAAPAAATGFINRKADATEATVDVTFDEAVDATAAMLLGNWTGSNGQSATAVAMIGTSSYRVTFDAPIAAADTISAANQVDVAGNAATGAISIAPVE